MDQEAQYIRGFNVGYLLSEHDPDLLKSLLKSSNEDEYFKGLSSGQKQFDREKLLSQIKQSQAESKKKKH